jgi:hypothetical protein
MTSARSRLLAHRGDWLKGDLNPNSSEALLSALKAGFGIETDLRDLNRRVVISHDPPTGIEDLLTDFLYRAIEIQNSKQALFALNIKSDGLDQLLFQDLSLLTGLDHFFFDMSTPELVKFDRLGLKIGLRVSEFENLFGQLSITKNPAAFWIDGFRGDWWSSSILEELEKTEVKLVFVSPELHRRDPSRFWDFFVSGYQEGRNWYLCTDYPWEVLELMGDV